MASDHRLTLIAPSRQAWDAQNETDTHLFGRPINYDALDFQDGERRDNGTTDQVVTGPLAELRAIEEAARVAGWITKLEPIVDEALGQDLLAILQSGRPPDEQGAAVALRCLPDVAAVARALQLARPGLLRELVDYARSAGRKSGAGIALLLTLALASCGSGSVSTKCVPVYRVEQAADGSASRVVRDGEVCR